MRFDNAKAQLKKDCGRDHKPHPGFSSIEAEREHTCRLEPCIFCPAALEFLEKLAQNEIQIYNNNNMYIKNNIQAVSTPVVYFFFHINSYTLIHLFIVR